MRTLEWTRYQAGFCTHPACMTRRGAGLSRQRYPALVFRIRHPTHGTILFDTGYSAHFMGATQDFPENLYRAVTPVHLGAGESVREQLWREGIGAEAVQRIFLSHLHGDHIGALADFPQARLWCARAAMDDLRGRGRISALRKGLLPTLLGDDFEARCSWLEAMPTVALPEELHAFGAGHDLLGDGSLIAIALPGHAAGHYGLLFSDDAGLVFLVADASWSSQALREHAPPPAITTGWLGDTAAYLRTFGRLCRLVQDAPHVRVVPSHCPEWLPHAR